MNKYEFGLPRDRSWNHTLDETNMQRIDSFNGSKPKNGVITTVMLFIVGDHSAAQAARLCDQLKLLGEATISLVHHQDSGTFIRVSFHGYKEQMLNLLRFIPEVSQAWEEKLPLSHRSPLANSSFYELDSLLFSPLVICVTLTAK